MRVFIFSGLLTSIFFLTSLNASAFGHNPSYPGKKDGYAERDLFNPGRINYFDANGRNEGYSEKDMFKRGRINHYDSFGHQEGYSEPDMFNRNRINYHDSF